MAKADVTDQLEKFPGAFAVSDETFYVEHMRQLLRWKRGETEWFNTGLVDTGKSLDVVGMKVYGAGDAGVYQLNSRGEWEKTSPEVPDKVISLVLNADRLYVATEQRGMFHVSLEEE